MQARGPFDFAQGRLFDSVNGPASESIASAQDDRVGKRGRRTLLHEARAFSPVLAIWERLLIRSVGFADSCRNHRGRSNGRRNYRPGQKEVVAVKVVVHTARDFCGLGTEGRPSAFEEDDHYNPPKTGIRVTGKPAIASSGMRTGAGLTQNFLFIEIRQQAARSTIFNRAGHAIRNFRN
jgi:hypothetical protein